MTEWEKFKVAELKEECKSRNISITGLKLKQQYIDKLAEYESNSQDAIPAEESVEGRTNGAFEEVEKDESPETAKESTTPSANNGDDQQNKEVQKPDAIEDIPLAVEMDKNLPANRPAALKTEDSQGPATEPEEDVPVANTAEEAKDIMKDDMLIPESTQVKVSDSTLPNETTRINQGEDVDMSNSEPEKVAQLEKEPTPPRIVDEPDVVVHDSTLTTDELRKRKRRSATPPPNEQEIRKKARGEHGDAIVRKTSPSKSPNAVIKFVSKDSESHDAPEQRTETGPERPEHEEDDHQAQPSLELARSMSHTPEIDEDKMTEPAIHAATRSLYLRNFKRPLNVPVLRAHVLTIAQGASSVAPGEEAIKFWYMNNIRSHAFATFTNISAASRVRTAMHQTRFPDEPQREPLWIDFVPDDKVESWVDQETGSSRGQRNSASKFEVVYNDTGEGVEAIFQESGAPKGPQRPSISAASTNRSTLPQRQLSYSADPSKTASIASGIHPDRAGLVPQDLNDRHKPSSPPISTPQISHSDQGKGFGALDDLFSYTATKPKLYFKPVSRDIVDERLDIIQDLYPDRGVSGDPGMKRYTFEKQAGRDEWVDNGPEFGHGKRGQDRLAGIGGRGRGGFRGRGGRGGFEGRFYGGDSYRGGGRR